MSIGHEDFGNTPYLSVSYEYDDPIPGKHRFEGWWVCNHPDSAGFTTRSYRMIMSHLMTHDDTDPGGIPRLITVLMEKHHIEITTRKEVVKAMGEDGIKVLAVGLDLDLGDLQMEKVKKVAADAAPRTAWVVPDDPKKRRFKDRDSALARAWELTPAGGKRAEPIEVEVTVPGRGSDPGVVNEEDFDFTVTGLVAVADEGFVLNTELRIPADSPLDVDRDAALIWTKVKTRLRKEAQKRGMVPVNGTFKTVTNHDAYDVTVVRSSCTVREPKPEESEFAAPPVTAGSRTGRFKVTPPPMVVSPRTPRISGAPDLSEEAKEADAEYRRMKKLMKKAGGGHITKAQMHADLERYMSEERGEKS